jgi:riboflavin synthase
MFTGLVEAVGRVVSLTPTPTGVRFQVEAPEVAATAQVGESIAVNGCCLTVVGAAEGVLSFDLLAESQRRTNFVSLAQGTRLNLERALRADARLGGHFVSGHVDAALPIVRWEASGADWVLEVSVPEDGQQYVVEKGSLAVDGISLTIAEVLPGAVRFWIIPHTRAQTNLSDKQAGDLVNIEYDLLAKYVEKLVRR